MLTRDGVSRSSDGTLTALTAARSIDEERDRQDAKWGVQCAAVAMAMIECIDRATPSTKPQIWRRCERSEAQEYRERVLTGSIGLEGAWSKWIEGRPEKTLMNREYEYRSANPRVLSEERSADSAQGDVRQGGAT